MIDKPNFETKIETYRGIYKEDAIQAYDAFKRKKRKVISNDILKKTIVKNYLILSQTMKDSLQNTMDMIKNLLLGNENNYLSFFYIAQYGGSKSQFIELIKDEIKRKGRHDQQFNSDKIIVLTFPGIVHITGERIFEQIIDASIRGVARQIQKDEEYSNIFSQIKSIMIETQLGITGADKKANIIRNLSIIRKSRDIEILDAADQIEANLQYVQFLNDELIMDKCIKLIEILSAVGFVFVWLFDELDQWFEPDSSKLSIEFQKKSRLFKEIFDLGAHGKIFYFFASTDRVPNIFKDIRNTRYSREADAALNRFYTILRDSQSKVEDGYYDDTIDQAVRHFAEIKFAITENNFPSLDFYTFLEKVMKFFKNSEYKRWDRRGANIEIIKTLDNYFILKDSFKAGIIESQKKNWSHLGMFVPQRLTTIFQHLQISYSFTRAELKVGNKRIDGKFNISRTGNTDIFLECKVAQKLDSLNVDQVLEATQVTSSQLVIFLVFGPFLKEIVENKVYNYFIDKAKETAYKRVKIIVINNELAYLPIFGLYNITSTTGSDKLIHIHKACAKFLEVFSDLDMNLYAIFNQHKMLFPNEHPSTADQEEIVDEILHGENNNKEQIVNEEKSDLNKIFTELEPIDQLTLALLRFLKKKKEFSPKGSKRVGRIEEKLRDDETGLLQSLPKIGNRLFQLNFLKSKTDKTWIFAPIINDPGKDRSLSTKEFEDLVIKEILNKKTMKPVYDY